jgi:5'-3' exonuclease
MTSTTIYVDASYFIFYRFYALIQWWNIARNDEPLEEPIDNPEFVEKFRSTFIEKVREIPKKCGINVKKDNVDIIVARDCPRCDIWRMALFPEYKQTRDYSDFKGKPFFRMAYSEKLFEAAGVKTILRHPKLEADDCIAISVKKELKNTTNNCIIIGSDHDYLQLINDRIRILNLKYKNVADSKNGSYDSKRNLFIKIVMGDKSDNIPSIFPKCGIKTAIKCYEDEDYYTKKKTLKSEELFNRNNSIINFDCIPLALVNEFLQ